MPPSYPTRRGRPHTEHLPPNASIATLTRHLEHDPKTRAGSTRGSCTPSRHANTSTSFFFFFFFLGSTPLSGAVPGPILNALLPALNVTVIVAVDPVLRVLIV